MLTSRDRVEVPNGGTMATAPIDTGAADHKVPSDPGRTDRPGPLENMPVPKTIGIAGEGVGSGPATNEATVNSVPTRPTNPSGWTYGPVTNNPPAPEPRWSGDLSGPMPPSSGGSTHPALR